MREVVLVLREPGRHWVRDRAPQDQPLWEAHALFMDTLFADGALLFGGPLAEAPQREVLIVALPRRDAALAMLAPDPWLRHGILRVAAAHAWRWREDYALTGA